VCGLLRKHWSYHAGFAAAGVGMVIGLVLFLLMQKRIVADVHAAGNDLSIAKKEVRKVEDGNAYRDAKVTEPDEMRPGHGGFSGFISTVFPWMLLAIAIAAPVLYVVSIVRGKADWLDAVMPIAFAGVAGW